MTIACAVGPCNDLRVSGTSYCAKHGPKRSRKATLVVTTPAGSGDLACAVGACANQRESGTSYCANHGPMTGRNAPHYNRTSKTPSASKTLGSSQILCPHCQVRGRVHTKTVKVKRGISGGKAVGALLTGGKSLWMTGLSRKEKTTQATCGNCRVTWMI